MVGLDELRLRDTVRVHRLDASESTRVLPSSDGVYDTQIWGYGVFLCVKGVRARHLVIAREVVVHERVFHYNVILVGMAEKVVMLRLGDLDPGLLGDVEEGIGDAREDSKGRLEGVVGSDGSEIHYLTRVHLSPELAFYSLRFTQVQGSTLGWDSRARTLSVYLNQRKA